MSIITTVYTERLTITTDDDGNVTMQRTSSADTHSAYLFDELSKEAQDRAIAEAIEEEERGYCSGDWYASQTGISERDILDAAEELAKAQNIEVTQDQGCSWYGTARGSWWHHAADWEAVTEQQHNGMAVSMDICDAWNTYAARIIILQEGHEEATDRAAEFWSVYSDFDYTKWDAETDEERRQLEAIADTAAEAAAEFERVAERIEDAAEELTEDAARAVGNTVDGLIEAEHGYYTSAEFWNEWLNDGETRFTRDGQRI